MKVSPPQIDRLPVLLALAASLSACEGRTERVPPAAVTSAPATPGVQPVVPEPIQPFNEGDTRTEQPASEPRAEAPQPSSEAYEITSLDRLPEMSNAPEIRQFVEESYPASLNVSGDVGVRFIIKDDGTVDESSIEVVDAPHDGLTAPSVEVARRMKFRPGQVGGRNVPVAMLLPIRWSPSQ